MTTLIAEVYDAFKSAGVDDEKARAASQAIAEYSHDIADIKATLVEIKATQALMKWMIGFNLTFTIVMFWKLFS
jgi:hypothetical protein